MTLQTLPKYETYKNSGIEWLGEIPDSWELTKLGTCLTPVSKKNRADLPLLSITREQGVIERDIEDAESNHNFIPDDLSGYKVLEKGQFGMNKMKAWQGSYGVSKHTGIISPAYFVFDFAKVIDPIFFNWAIRSKLYVSYFGSASDGVRIGQWDLSKSRMKAIPFLLPSPEEQTAIAHFLDQKTAQIDAAIAIKEQQIALLKERKQILIQQAVTQGLDPTVPMKDSGVEWIGEIPAHWNAIKLAYIAKIDAGSTPDRSNAKYWGGDIPWIKTGEVNYSTIFETDEYISKSGLRNSSLRLAPPDTLLMAMYGQGVTRGRVAILGIAATYNQACCGMTFDNSADVNFAQYFFIAAYKYIRDEGNESSQMNLSAGYISSLKMVVPPKEEQTILVKFLNVNSGKIDDAVMLQQQQIEKLREYKTTLINSAVTGKIRVTSEMVAVSA
ncbi:MAG: restriction endonuclease subunit S [Thiothrix litoralis]|uniref:restriction endonuclease subunit S n=1 Tax=Thiothrix litoralis TaxID=2891210 RepID=UPI003C742267